MKIFLARNIDLLRGDKSQCEGSLFFYQKSMLCNAKTDEPITKPAYEYHPSDIDQTRCSRTTLSQLIWLNFSSDIKIQASKLPPAGCFSYLHCYNHCSKL